MNQYDRKADFCIEAVRLDSQRERPDKRSGIAIPCKGFLENETD